MTHLGQLALEHIDLAEENGHRCMQEQPGVNDALEQDQRLRHPILRHEI